VGGSVFVFGTDDGLFEHTGYVYSTFDPERTWRPFGIIPRSMVGGHFRTAVYETWIVFVRMTGTGPLCVAFDVAGCTWLEMPDMTAREWPCVAVLSHSLYVMGGATAETATPTDAGPPTELIRLDQCLGLGGQGQGLSCQWEKVGMPIARTKSAAVVVDDSIYVTGGYFRDPQSPAHTWSVSSALTRLHPGTRLVENMSPMASARRSHGSFVSSDGQIVVLGGAISRQFRERPHVVERFDFATWHPLELPADPTDPSGLNADWHLA
jgi:hypothetical protein